MSVCAAPTCSHQSFDGSSYYVDVDVIIYNVERRLTIQRIVNRDRLKNRSIIQSAVPLSVD
jgi:hypothetical protein